MALNMNLLMAVKIIMSMSTNILDILIDEENNVLIFLSQFRFFKIC